MVQPFPPSAVLMPYLGKPGHMASAVGLLGAFAKSCPVGERRRCRVILKSVARKHAAALN